MIHAAGESSPGNLPTGTYAIALAARDEAHLSEVSFALFRAGIKHVRVVEPDAPYSGQLMALGVPPGERSRLRRHLSSLPLLR